MHLSWRVRNVALLVVFINDLFMHKCGTFDTDPLSLAAIVKEAKRVALPFVTSVGAGVREALDTGSAELIDKLFFSLP